MLKAVEFVSTLAPLESTCTTLAQVKKNRPKEHVCSDDLKSGVVGKRNEDFVFCNFMGILCRF